MKSKVSQEIRCIMFWRGFFNMKPRSSSSMSLTSKVTSCQTSSISGSNTFTLDVLMLQISLHLLEIKLLTLQLTHSNRKVRGSVLFRLNCMVSNVWKGKEKCKSSLLEHSYWFIPDRFQKATTSNIFPFSPLLLLL